VGHGTCRELFGQNVKVLCRSDESIAAGLSVAGHTSAASRCIGMGSNQLMALSL